MRHGDDLVDFASGGVTYHLDGTQSDPGIRYGDRFDAAAISPSGRYALLHERLGTKGLLLDGGRIVKEVERSDNNADAYEYPAAFAILDGRREILFHCPHAYNRITALDAATGVDLMPEDGPGDPDFFHSRLMVSPGGRWLASAGWIWHPIDSLMIFDTVQLLGQAGASGSRKPGICDQRLRDNGQPEVDSVAFLSESELVVSLYTLRDAPGPVDETPTAIEIWNLAEDRLVSSAKLAELSGPLLPVDREWLIGFHGHPKLIHLPTGRVQQRWSHIDTSTCLGSICWHHAGDPIVALDRNKRRFALCDGKGILVGTLRASSS